MKSFKKILFCYSYKEHKELILFWNTFCRTPSKKMKLTRLRREEQTTMNKGKLLTNNTKSSSLLKSGNLMF